MSRIEHYRACAAKGMSIPDTARLHGVSVTAVREANERYGLGFPVRKGRDLVVMRERLTQLTADGKSRREIAMILKVPRNTVITWGKRWGVRNPAWKSREGSGRKPLMPVLEQHLTAQEAEDLRFLKRKGYTYRDALAAIKRTDLLEGLK